MHHVRWCDSNVCHAACVSVSVSVCAGSPAARELVASWALGTGPRVLLVPLAHGGGAAGLTLTAARHVAFLEPPVDAGLEAQVGGGMVGFVLVRAVEQGGERASGSLNPSNPYKAPRNWTCLV